MNEVIDALADILEPSPTIEVDASAAPPIEYRPGVLYLYPSGRETHTPAGPPCERVDFEVTALYLVDDAGELELKQRDRAVSDLMDAKALAYLEVIRQNRSKGPGGEPRPWLHIVGAVDYDRIHALEVRGVAIIITGYWMVGP